MEIRNFLEYNRSGRTSVEDRFAYRLLQKPLYGYFIRLFDRYLLISYKRVETLNSLQSVSSPCYGRTYGRR